MTGDPNPINDILLWPADKIYVDNMNTLAYNNVNVSLEDMRFTSKDGMTYRIKRMEKRGAEFYPVFELDLKDSVENQKDIYEKKT